MKLNGTNESTCLIFDIETLKRCFLIGFYNVDTKEYIKFEISEYRNDLYSLLKFYNKSNIDYAIGFNNLGFDAQVLHFMQNSAEHWYDLKGEELTSIVYKWVQDLIESQKYKQRLPYYESQFFVPQLDCFTILGLNNEARYSSLKKIEFSLDFFNVQEMPIHHSVEQLTQEDIEMIADYMKNDIMATHQLFLLVLGVTEHPLYKGNNQLELRYSIQEEYGINCLNYSDIKIGEELMKLSYAKEIKKDVGSVPKKGTFRKYIKLNTCVPDYIEFETSKLQEILASTKKKVLDLNEKHEIKFRYGALNTEYTIGVGGGHSTNKNQTFLSDEDSTLIDLDVSSLYPAIIVNEGYYPAHLGIKLLNVYRKLYEKRIQLKPSSKNNKKIKGICDAIKLILNSAYGKMGSMESFLYDKKVPYSVCLTGQFNLFMLIERMEMNKIPCFSMNTDGATFIVRNELKETFYEIWKWWENKTNLLLEETIFKSIYYSTVNDYLAVTKDDKIKTKGDFMIDFELHKNKSMRIRSLALKEYFVNGISPIEYISSHKNIYDFCIMSKVNGEARLELEYDDRSIEQAGKLFRYYITNEKNAPQLFKRGIGTVDNVLNVNQQAPNELGIKRVKDFNTYSEYAYSIDHPQYIYETFKIIAKVENNRKDLNYMHSLAPNLQTSLF